MPSVQHQLIAEITDTALDLTPDEVSYQITRIIEKEILPDVITNLKLPNLPSPITVRHEELMEKRYGKRSHASLRQKVKFIQDLEKIRTKWNGSAVTDKTLRPSNGHSNQAYIRFFPRTALDVESIKKPVPNEPNVIVRKQMSSSPLIKPEDVAKKYKLIEFNNQVINQIVKNPSFEIFISAIESKFRKIFKQNDLSFIFSIQTDSFYPTTERTMINIIASTNNFEEKMKLWDKVELVLKSVIDNLNVSDDERKEINRNTFTNIEVI